MADLPLTIAGWRARYAADPHGTLTDAITRARHVAATHGAFITVADAASTAHELPFGSLKGVPFAVKDNIDTARLRTTGGSAAFASRLPVANAPTVSALQAAGAWIVGKANLHELAFGVTSENAAFGPVRNPVDSRRSAGGSSGGSAVAIALGVVPFALGTDTGGSMTIPAAACGVVGYRPGSGSYPKGGVINISTTRDEVGVMATTVADVRLVDGILRGASVGPVLPNRAAIRLGVPIAYVRDLDDAVRAVFDATLLQIRSAGVELVAVEMDDVVESARGHGFAVVGFEAPRALAHELGDVPEPAAPRLRELVDQIRSPDVRAILAHLIVSPVPYAQYLAALTTRLRLRNRMCDLLVEASIHALVYPTLAGAPPIVGSDTMRLGDDDVPVFEALTRHTETGSFIGAPSISIPISVRGGLPVGLTLEGAPGTDGALLATALELEHLLGDAPPTPAGGSYALERG